MSEQKHKAQSRSMFGVLCAVGSFLEQTHCKYSNVNKITSCWNSVDLTNLKLSFVLRPSNSLYTAIVNHDSAQSIGFTLCCILISKQSCLLNFSVQVQHICYFTVEKSIPNETCNDQICSRIIFLFVSLSNLKTFNCKTILPFLHLTVLNSNYGKKLLLWQMHLLPKIADVRPNELPQNIVLNLGSTISNLH